MLTFPLQYSDDLLSFCNLSHSYWNVVWIVLWTRQFVLQSMLIQEFTVILIYYLPNKFAYNLLY